MTPRVEIRYSVMKKSWSSSSPGGLSAGQVSLVAGVTGKVPGTLIPGNAVNISYCPTVGVCWVALLVTAPNLGAGPRPAGRSFDPHPGRRVGLGCLTRLRLDR